MGGRLGDEGGAWRRPAEALESWRSGKEKVAPPVLLILKELAGRRLEDAIAALRDVPAEFEGSGRAVDTAPGYAIVPLETPPLPPSIPTNTFLVGCHRFVVVDPGPRREQGRDHLRAVIDARLAAGDRLEAVVLTHHHPDHIGALEEVARRYRTPVWAHAITGRLLQRRLDRELDEGDAIDLAGEGDPEGGGRPAQRLRVLFTPGHAEGHIVLHDQESRSLVGGDLVSTLVSMYVGAPGGNLRQYLASLERLRGLSLAVLYPAHGTPCFDPAKLIDDTVRHRRRRVEQVYSLLSAEPQAAEAVARRVYPEALPELRQLMVRSTRAALDFLVEAGRALTAGDDAYRRRGSG